MIKQLVIFLVLLLAFSTDCPARSYELKIAGGRMSINANEIPLSVILADLSVRTGVQVEIDPQMNPSVTVNFENQSIEKGLANILGQLNHIIEWEKNSERKGELVPSVIKIFKPSDSNRQVRWSGIIDFDFDNSKGFYTVKNELLVRIPSIIDEKRLEELLLSYSAVIVEKDEASLVYRIRFPDGTDLDSIIDRLSRNPLIRSAEFNQGYQVNSPYRYLSNQSIPERLNLSALDNRGVSVAVLDSGLADGNVPAEFLAASLDALSSGRPLLDPLGHGTQMALVASGIIAPIAKGQYPETNVPVVAIRAVDQNGFTTSFAVMKSIEFALSQNARVLSLSWGSSHPSEFIREALQKADNMGLIVVASAGNNPTGTPIYPAAFKSVIAIGALFPDGRPWDMSNYGDFVDVSLPGFAQMPVGYQSDPGIYAGTSISTAFGANLIADFLMKNPGASKRQIITYLKSAVQGNTP